MSLDISLAAFGTVLSAGFLSVASPCVLPVLPVLMTGSGKDHRARPVVVVLGLATTFIVMGMVASLAGSVIAGKMALVEKVVGGIFVVFGTLLLLDTNIFKSVQIFNRIPMPKTEGLGGGFLLGASLGLVWIPCVGPILSSILAMVAGRGDVAYGVVLLAIYSLGFAIPMLIAAYFSHWFLNRFRRIARFPNAIRVVSGLLLIVFGLVLMTGGMMVLSL